MTQSKSPAKATGNGAVRPYERMVEDLRGLANLDSAGQGFEIAANVIDSIAQATSEDEIFAANELGPISLKDSENLHNVPVGVYDVTFHKSDSKYEENSLGAYCVFRCMDDSGNDYLVSTGAPQVVASLRMGQLNGLIKEERPWRIRFTARPTANGVLLRIARP